MLLTPLVVVFALAAIDYAVWNWALGANHEVVALIAGLTMAPLAIALAWLVALALGSGAVVLARRLGRQIAIRLLDARPSRSLRLADGPPPRGEIGDPEPVRDRLAA